MPQLPHSLKVLAGCALSLWLIFLFPAFGIREEMTSFVFVVLMFACHLFMMRGHHHDGHDDAP